MRVHNFLPLVAFRRRLETCSCKQASLFYRANSSVKLKSRETRSPVKLSKNARQVFEMMLKGDNNREAVQISYQQSKDGLQMVFSFNFLHQSEVEMVESRSPPDEYATIFADDSIHYKLYVHPNALMKVIGATVDVDIESMNFSLQDKEGLPLEA